MYLDIEKDICESDIIDIELNNSTRRRINYYPSEKCFKIDRKKENIKTPPSVIFKIELAKFLRDMINSAYNSFKAQVGEKSVDDIKPIQLDSIDADFSLLSKWFEEEKREFSGYDKYINSGINQTKQDSSYEMIQE